MTLRLDSDEQVALTRTRTFLRADLRFEHLRKEGVDDATWRFVCQAHSQRKGDLVVPFVAENAREPSVSTCYFPVELLTIASPAELFGIRLLPAPEPSVGPAVGSVIAVECTGTSLDGMVERARPIAERALRLMRATFREAHFMPDRQLRFQLGDTYWFDDHPGGWAMRSDVGWALEVDSALLRQAASQEISTLPLSPTKDIERRAELALQWFERAQLATDPLLELLYLFFALEAILGDSSEGLKGPNLALRRALLGLATTGGFSHPARAFLLYDEVRSAAVHGEIAPAVDQREIDVFAWDVRRAINEFVGYARRKGLTKRAQVRQTLDAHKGRQRVIDGLLKQDARLWRVLLKLSSDTDAK